MSYSCSPAKHLITLQQPPNIRPPHITIHTSHAYIAICDLSRSRDTRVCDFRHENLFVALRPVCIWRTHHDLFRAHMHMYSRV
jgi:hypothetical protein